MCRPGRSRARLVIRSPARLMGMAWCVTLVTVGELWQWATTRSWGPRTREDLELWLGRVVILNSDDATSRTWGRISAEARRRGRPRPANDSCRARRLPGYRSGYQRRAAGVRGAVRGRRRPGLAEVRARGLLL